MPLEQRSASSQTGLAIILLIVIIVAGAWFAVKPAYSNYKQAKTQLDGAEIRLQERQNAQQNVDKLLSEYQSNLSRIEIIKSALPPDLEAAQILPTLESLGLQSGLIMESVIIEDEAIRELLDNIGSATVNNAQPTAQPNLNVAAISLGLTGTHEGFKIFLESLEKSLRLFDIQLISASEGDGGVVEFSVQLNVYYL